MLRTAVLSLVALLLPTAVRAEAGKELFQTVAKGDRARLEQLLAAGADPNVMDFGGSTPLIDAARAGRADLIEPLLRHRADPNLGRSDTPVGAAVYRKHWAAALLLAKHGGRCGSAYGCEESVVKQSVASGDTGILAAMLAAAAGKRDGDTVALRCALLIEAARVGGMAEVELLLGHGADPDCKDTNGFTPLMHLRGERAPALARRLLAAGAHVDAAATLGDTPLLQALAWKQRELASVLLAAGAQVVGKGDRDPLGVAAGHGDVAMMQALFERGARNEGQLDHALVRASANGHGDAARWLLAHGASAKRRPPEGGTAIAAAAGNGHAALVSLLLEHGADPNAAMASASGEVVKLLLARGARPVKDGADLRSAAEAGRVADLDVLLAAGADVDQPDGRGETALVFAARGGHADCVRRLVAARATLEPRFPSQRSALMVAAERGHRAVVETLVLAGADLARKDDLGRTALDLVMELPRDQRNGVDRILVDHHAPGRSYVLGMPTTRLLWDVLVISFAVTYLGSAAYLQQKTYDGRTADNPFRWVSYGLLVGGGATVFGWSLVPSQMHDPTGMSGIGRAYVMMVSAAATVGYGVGGLLLRNNKVAYYTSAGLVATLPLLSLRF